MFSLLCLICMEQHVLVLAIFASLIERMVKSAAFDHIFSGITKFWELCHCSQQTNRPYNQLTCLMARYAHCHDFREGLMYPLEVVSLGVVNVPKF